MSNENLIFLVLMGLTAALGAWGIAQLLMGITARRERLAERMASNEADRVLLSRSMLLKESTSLPGPLGGLRLAQKLAELLRRARPEANPLYFLLVLAGLAAAGLFAGLALRNIGLAVIAPGAAVTLSILVVHIMGARRQKLMLEQLVDALDFLARVLRSGHSLGTGFRMMGEELPQPLAGEFGRCHDQHSLGMTIEQAMTDMTRRVTSTEFAFFVTSVVIQRQTGGDLAAILDNIAATIRARVRIGQHLKALTAEGRATGWVLMVMPVICYFIILVLNPSYASKLTDNSLGIRMLMIGGALQVFGMLLIHKIVSFKM